MRAALARGDSIDSRPKNGSRLSCPRNLLAESCLVLCAELMAGGHQKKGHAFSPKQPLPPTPPPASPLFSQPNSRSLPPPPPPFPRPPSLTGPHARVIASLCISPRFIRPSARAAPDDARRGCCSPRACFSAACPDRRSAAACSLRSIRD
jgi:hypothetical protein